MTDAPRSAGMPGRLRGALIAVVLVALAGGMAFAVRPLTQSGAPPTAIATTPAPPPVPETPAPPPTERVREQTLETQPPGQPRAEEPVLAAPPVDPRLRPFTGLSTWIDIYDVDLTPAEQIERAAAGGVQLIYVQSARHKSETDIDDAGRLAEVIDLAHDHGMLVMTWYVPDFVRQRRDLRRSQAAIAFRTARGDRPDAFGLDIEIEDLPDTAERSRRLLALSRTLRDWVGPDYPMAAIVLPPLQLDLRPGWWPDFPYAELTAFYNAFIPMNYSSFRGTDADTTYRWNVGNVDEMRRRAEDDALVVHVAGGIADNLPEVETFVRAVRDVDALGGGLYDLHTTQPDAWRTLQRLRYEPDAAG